MVLTRIAQTFRIWSICSGKIECKATTKPCKRKLAPICKLIKTIVAQRCHTHSRTRLMAKDIRALIEDAKQQTVSKSLYQNWAKEATESVVLKLSHSKLSELIQNCRHFLTWKTRMKFTQSCKYDVINTRATSRVQTHCLPLRIKSFSHHPMLLSAWKIKSQRKQSTDWSYARKTRLACTGLLLTMFWNHKWSLVVQPWSLVVKPNSERISKLKTSEWWSLWHQTECNFV